MMYSTLVRTTVLAWLAILAWPMPLRADEEYRIHTFERKQLSDQHFCEGATCADLDRDGSVDVIAGPYLYHGPDFSRVDTLYPPVAFGRNEYSDHFFTFAHDIDQDDWLDVVIIGFPGKEAWWLRNPGRGQEPWQRHLAYSAVDNESPTFTDLTGDGQPELVCHTGGRFGYAEYDAKDVTRPWTFRPVSPDVGYPQFTHGLG
ncbi:MAG TPA: VCBS repeat-containing protein, partial [Pirellulaceae bacterium]